MPDRPSYDELRQRLQALEVRYEKTRQAKKALRASEAHDRLLFENLTSGFALHEIIVDPRGRPCDYRFLNVNPAFEQLTGLEARAVVGRTVLEVLPATEPHWIETYGQVALTRKPVQFESFSAALARHFQVTAYSPQPGQFATIFEDITKRTRDAQALRESRKELAEIFSMSLDMICIADINSATFLKVSPAFNRTLGFSEAELLNQSFLDFIHPDDVDATLQIIEDKLKRGDKVLNFTNRYRCKDGSYRWLDWVSVPLPERGLTFAVARDITERKLAERERQALEAQLQQVQRLKAIGTLAGGVAHDFNNLLMGIQGNVSLMTTDPETPHPLREHLTAIEEYVRSATHLTRQLLGFARSGKYEVKPIDIHAVLKRSAKMFGPTKKEIQIHTRLQAAPAIVEADRRQLEQVLFNLYVNAWQAMPAGGDLFLETRTVTLNKTFCRSHQLNPGRFTGISIRDTGMGMPADVRQRVFDPFFTTKEKTRGTGLGLASAYGIITNHGGTITVDSAQGAGRPGVGGPGRPAGGGHDRNHGGSNSNGDYRHDHARHGRRPDI
jgi:PAS domain S-box-containing protein